MGRALKMDEFLLSANVMVENALSDDGIRQAVAAYGYTDTRLNQGRKLYEEAVALHNAQRKEYGEQFQATADLEKAWDEADRVYAKTVSVARVALADSRKAGVSLQIAHCKKQSVSGWIEQASMFYWNLTGDAELLSLMEHYGYSAEKLRAEAELVAAVHEKNQRQKKEMGEAQEATEKRDAKLDELARWVSDFRVILKVALDDHPQWLEKVGIQARSQSRPKTPETSGTPEETETEPQPA